MIYGSRGEEVEHIQGRLLGRGYTLPRFGADGDLGSETWTALFNYAGDHGFAWREEDFEEEVGFVPAAVVNHLQCDAPRVELRGASEFFDITGEHALTKGRKAPRDHSTVDTILLHQTAVKFGTTRRNREKYGERKALHRRFYNVACHVAALRNGDVLYVNRLPRYVWQGNVANRFSIGIEIEGHYSGIEGNPKTISGGKTPDVLDERTIESARAAVRFAVEEGRRLGMPITKIQAHRNYSGSRRNDPGESIWKAVALWAVPVLGLCVDHDVARNGGRPIPQEWDPAGLYDWRGDRLVR